MGLKIYRHKVALVHRIHRTLHLIQFRVCLFFIDVLTFFIVIRLLLVYVNINCVLFGGKKLKHRQLNKLFGGKRLFFFRYSYFWSGLGLVMYFPQQQPIYYTFIRFVTHII